MDISRSVEMLPRDTRGRPSCGCEAGRPRDGRPGASLGESCSGSGLEEEPSAVDMVASETREDLRLGALAPPTRSSPSARTDALGMSMLAR